MKMGTTLSAKKIQGALAKARDVGVVEEPLTIGDVALVLRNLRPDQYTAIYTENNEREGVDHLFSFQISHVCRSIVEINGIDLRDVEYVEVEEPVKDPKTQKVVLDPDTNEPKLKKVLLERHDYVRTYLLAGWAKEPLQIAWRKFNDVLKLSEDKSKEGITFVLPEMSPEERLREAIGNVREVIEDVPAGLVESILEEAGLMRISTADEIKRAMETTSRIAREQEASEKAKEAPQAAPQPAPPQSDPAPGPRVRQATPEEIMARRSPLNREAVDIPNPTVQPTIASPQTVPQPSAHVSGPDALKAAQRAAQIARLETDGLEIPVSPPGLVSGSTPVHAPNAPHLQTGVPPEVAVLAQKGRERVDMKAFETIVNKPPTAGINPRFRPAR
jgi:hypothetical protein